MNAKSEIAMVTNPPAREPRPSESASLTREAPVEEVRTAPVSRSISPEQSTVKAVRVHTTMVGHD